jgi:hypothetical protein
MSNRQMKLRLYFELSEFMFVGLKNCARRRPLISLISEMINNAFRASTTIIWMCCMHGRNWSIQACG